MDRPVGSLICPKPRQRATFSSRGKLGLANPVERRTRKMSQASARTSTPTTTKPLAGRAAVVTGGSRGIGHAIALRLARDGAKVAIGYLESRDLAAQLAEQINGAGGEAMTVRADVSEYAQVDKMMDDVLARWGPFDILVNNAGIVADRTMKKLPMDEWSRVVAVDLSGVFHCCRAVLRDPPRLRMVPSSRIINIASVVGEEGRFGQSNYAAAKAGVIALTKTLAREVAFSGVTVNAVAPGFVKTRLTAGMPPTVLDAVVKQIPLGRLAEPEEIAATVGFLCSLDASYLTGTVLDVNGGLRM